LRFHRLAWLHPALRRATGWLLSLAAVVTIIAVGIPARAAPAYLPPAMPPAQTPTRLNFVSGVAQVQDSVTLNNNKIYLFFGQSDQRVQIQLLIQSGSANFEVRGDNNVAYKAFSNPALDWSFTLPETQDYRITVSSTTQAFYTLVVTLSSGAPQRITFLLGQTTATATGVASPSQSPQFVFTAGANQLIRVLLSSAGGFANFSLAGVSDSVVYKPASNLLREWSFTTPGAPATQDYLITVTSPTPVAFTLEITVPGTTPPSAERITIPTGGDTAVVSGSLAPTVPKQYIFRASAGQTVRILLSALPAGNANFSLSGVSDGFVYKQASDPLREWTFTVPTTQDYLITLLATLASTYTLELYISPFPTPPPSPQPTIPAGCTTDTILNGGFENDAFWIFGDSPVPPAYVSTDFHTPARAIRMGITPDMGPIVHPKESFSSIRQPFEISPFATTAQLRWWSLYRSEEAPTDSPGDGQDKQQVILLAPDLSTVAVLRSVRRNTGSWQPDMVDLTSYRGRQLLLYFNVFNDGSGLRTWQFLDDVVLSVCYPAVTPTPVIPTVAPTPIPPTPILLPTPIPPTLVLLPTPIPATPLNLPSIAALTALAVNGEPRIAVVTAPAQPRLTPTPVVASTGINQSPQEVLFRVGVVLGTLAVIGLIVGVTLWLAGRRRTP